MEHLRRIGLAVCFGNQYICFMKRILFLFLLPMLMCVACSDSRLPVKLDKAAAGAAVRAPQQPDVIPRRGRPG
jgi:hypothetical protein